jgi:putative membrane protein
MEAEKIPDQQLREKTEKDLDPRVDLAVERTELALERTQLAWVRTLLSMIGGGFVIDKAMDAVHQNRLASGRAILQYGHMTGFLITGLGTLFMILVTVNYGIRARKLAAMKGVKKSFLEPGFLLSVFTITIGLVLLYFIYIDDPLG